MADTVAVQGSSSSDLSAVVHRISYFCTGTGNIKTVFTYGSVFSDVFRLVTSKFSIYGEGY